MELHCKAHWCGLARLVICVKPDRCVNDERADVRSVITRHTDAVSAPQSRCSETGRLTQLEFHSPHLSRSHLKSCSTYRRRCIYQPPSCSQMKLLYSHREPMVVIGMVGYRYRIPSTQYQWTELSIFRCCGSVSVPVLSHAQTCTHAYTVWGHMCSHCQKGTAALCILVSV